MKLLKGRKLLEAPKALSSPRLKFIEKLRKVYQFFRHRKLALLNIIISLGVLIYGINYLLKRQDNKALEMATEQKIEEQGEDIKQEFFETVYEDELEAERLAVAQEERRQQLIEEAGEGENIIFEEASAQSIEELEKMTEDQTVVSIPVNKISENIDKGEVSDWQLYENKTFRYKVEYPPSWFTDNQTNESAWLAYITQYDPTGISRSSEPISVRVEILVQENYRGFSLDDWVNQKHQLLGNPTTSDRRQIGGVDAIVDQVRGFPDTIEATIMRDKYVYTVSFLGNNIYELNHMKVFNYILDKFKFTENNDQ